MDRRPDDLLSLIIKDSMALGSTAFATHQRKNGPTAAEQLDQAVCGRLADIHLGSELSNLCHGCAIGSTAQKSTNRICPSARFVPKRLVYLVWKRILHARPRENRLEFQSHIKWQKPMHVIKLNANSQIKRQRKRLKSLALDSHN